MMPASEALEKALVDIKPQTENVPFFSTVTGRRCAGPECDAAHWGRGVRQSVQFASAVNALSEFGVDVWLEIGAHPALSHSIQECLAGREGKTSVMCSARREREHESLLETALDLHRAAVPLEFAGREDAFERAKASLSAVGLQHRLTHYPGQLSGGEQQRVALARAFAVEPSLLLADEPTGNVDDVIGLRLMYLFEELNRLGTTVVIATHNDTLVSRFNHRQLRIESSSIRVFDPRPMTGYPPPSSSATAAAAAQSAAQLRRPGPGGGFERGTV